MIFWFCLTPSFKTMALADWLSKLPNHRDWFTLVFENTIIPSCFYYPFVSLIQEKSVSLQKNCKDMKWIKSKISDLIEEFERGISYSSEEIKDNSGVPMMNLACIDKTGFYLKVTY